MYYNNRYIDRRYIKKLYILKSKRGASAMSNAKQMSLSKESIYNKNQGRKKWSYGWAADILSADDGGMHRFGGSSWVHLPDT